MVFFPRQGAMAKKFTSEGCRENLDPRFLPYNTLRLFQPTELEHTPKKSLPTRPSFGIPFIVVDWWDCLGCAISGCVVSFLDNTEKIVQTSGEFTQRLDGAKTLGDHGINYLIVFFFGGSGPSNKRGDKTPHPGVDPWHTGWFFGCLIGIIVVQYNPPYTLNNHVFFSIAQLICNCLWTFKRRGRCPTCWTNPFLEGGKDSSNCWARWWMLVFHLRQISKVIPLLWLKCFLGPTWPTPRLKLAGRVCLSKCPTIIPKKMIVLFQFHWLNEISDKMAFAGFLPINKSHYEVYKFRIYV